VGLLAPPQGFQGNPIYLSETGDLPNIAGAGIYQAGNVVGIAEAIYENSAGGRTQITSNGTLNVNALGIVPVTKGGTGMDASGVTNGQILIGNDGANGFALAALTAGANISVTNGAGSVSLAVSGVLPVTVGGTGVNASTVTDGQLLIGNDAANGFSVAALTAGTGISIANGAGSVTITNTSPGGAGADTTAFHNGGDSFGGAAVIGTNDGFSLALETGGTSRMRLETGAYQLGFLANGTLDMSNVAAGVGTIRASSNDSNFSTLDIYARPSSFIGRFGSDTASNIGHLLLGSSTRVGQTYLQVRGTPPAGESLTILAYNVESGGVTGRAKLRAQQSGSFTDIETIYSGTQRYSSMQGSSQFFQIAHTNDSGSFNHLIIVGTATAAIAGEYLSLQPPAVATGSHGALVVKSAAHTAQTAGTELVDVDIRLNRTLQFATGAITSQRAMKVLAPTYGFVGASVITNAATLYIDAAPTAGANATITNGYALWVDAGTTRLDGDLDHDGANVGFFAAAPVAQQVVTALGGSAGGTADDTLVSIPDPADTPVTADALRDDLVANVLPVIRNDIDDCRAKITALRTALVNYGLVA
jgi:hypothetical protein